MYQNINTYGDNFVEQLVDDSERGVEDGEHQQRECQGFYASFQQKLLLDQGVKICEAVSDSASCWPPTPVGYHATVSCPGEFKDVQYDTNFNATRFCNDNGTWANLSDYDTCANNILHVLNEAANSEDLAHLGVMGVYYTGYVVSLFSSCIALWLFVHFRTLRCLRNTLHCNLIITYILLDLIWIIMTSVIVGIDGKVKEYRMVCRSFVAIFNYFQVTNFFWMLVEGLYIILIIFRPHKLELLNFWPFAIVGWGLPMIVTTTWVSVKIGYDNHDCWFSDINSAYNFVYIGPILLILAVNLVFLATIMHVLLRKYRGTSTTAASTRRTARSFLILLPLFGVTYVMVLVLPKENGNFRTVMKYVTAVFNSTQGFIVSLLYCFLNNEVRSIIRMRGNSFFPYRTWLKLYTPQPTQRCPRTFTMLTDNGSGMCIYPGSVHQPQAPQSPYRPHKNLRQMQFNTSTANRNEMAYLLKEQKKQQRTLSIIAVCEVF